MSEGLVRTLTGHAGSVVACAISPDTRFIVSGSADFTARIWEVESGNEVATLAGHGGTVSKCSFSRDGSFLVTASADRTLKIWETATWSERKTLVGHEDAVMSCAVSPDGSFIASAGLDGAVGVWDVAAGTARTILRGHTDQVFDCAISPDGRTIASASPDATLRLWDAATGAEKQVLKGSLGVAKFYGCAFSHNGSAVAGVGDAVYVWDLRDATDRFKMTANGAPLRCAFSPDDSLIVTAGALYNTLAIWDLSTRKMKSRLLGTGGTVRDCCFSPDGRLIVSADGDLKTLRVWDVERGLQLGTGGCFIATAAYGSEDHAEVARLRAFRDDTLRRTRSGRAAIRIYERLSPPIARVVAGSPSCRAFVRLLILRPMRSIVTARKEQS